MASIAPIADVHHCFETSTQNESVQSTTSCCQMMNPGSQSEESRILFEHLFTSSPLMQMLFSRNGLMCLANRSFEKGMGLSSEQATGKNYMYFISNEEQNHVTAMVKRSVMTRSSVTTEAAIRGFERPAQRVEMTITPIIRAERIEGFLVTAQQRTHTMQVGAIMAEATKKYQDIVEYALQGMFQSTPEGYLIMANRSLLTMLGYDSFDELANLDLADIYVHPEDRLHLVRALSEKGQIKNYELKLKKKNRQEIIVLEHARAIRDEKKTLLYFEGMLEDITIRKALEERLHEHVRALKASREALDVINKQRDKFVSILSHDLRSPLASILGFCEILTEDRKVLSEAEMTEYLGYIKESTQQQLGLVTKLLDWTRLESGRMRIEMTEVDLFDVVKSSISSLLGIAKQKNILLFSNLKPRMCIKGDRALLLQVFNNLIGNALKFTPAQGVIQVEFTGEDEATWVVTIKDSGVGIPAADLGKLFKIEEKYTRRGLAGEEGTGLGLSVVHEIVKKHLGSIIVASEADKGTEFSLWFPKSVGVAELKILVIDDEPGIRVLHSKYITRLFPNAKLIHAKDGKEGFLHALKHRPNLIITDYAMPEVNGFDFLTRLKQEQATKEIPVLVVTGEDSASSREALMLSGAVDVLVKPVSPAQFERFIKSELHLE